MAAGIATKAPQRGGGVPAKGSGFYKGLTRPERRLIRGQQGQNKQIQQAAGNLLPQVEQAYSQPFDYSQLPSAPVQGDFNAWRQQQIDSTNAEFDRRNTEGFQKQDEELQQWAANTGNAPGSPAYNARQKLLLQSQNDARQSAQAQGMAMAGQNAEQFFNIGTTARGNQLAEGLQARNMPAQEYGILRGFTDPSIAQSTAFGQQGILQTQDERNKRWLLQHTPRGGGGGGAGPMWQQYGFSSPMEFDAYQTAQNQANQQWQWANDPKYRQPSGPSYGSQLLGGGLGILGGMAGNYFFGK